ncbi:MAG: hypothetical protein IPP81_19360 [Chitinophagaceae bacterium]|nr:hypothetical protein [Chitinophagaceae bacterium]
MKALQELKKLIDKLETWDYETINLALKKTAIGLEVKYDKVMFAMRVALSGEMISPGGCVDLALILGKTHTLNRIEIALYKLNSQNNTF